MVELMIGEPSATSARLAQVISGLESDTVEAPRNLSITQLSRLDEIAAHHSGRIPLHGRLFAQWMHHAYPRECRFPHVAGTMNPLDKTVFAQQFGLGAEASVDVALGPFGRVDLSSQAGPQSTRARGGRFQGCAGAAILSSHRLRYFADAACGEEAEPCRGQAGESPGVRCSRGLCEFAC